MQASKSEWHAPELTVLVRRSPEEAVLSACKDSGLGGFNNENNQCHINVGTCNGRCLVANTS